MVWRMKATHNCSDLRPHVDNNSQNSFPCSWKKSRVILVKTICARTDSPARLKKLIVDLAEKSWTNNNGDDYKKMSTEINGTSSTVMVWCLLPSAADELLTLKPAEFSYMLKINPRTHIFDLDTVNRNMFWTNQTTWAEWWCPTWAMSQQSPTALSTWRRANC